MMAGERDLKGMADESDLKGVGVRKASEIDSGGEGMRKEWRVKGIRTLIGMLIG